MPGGAFNRAERTRGTPDRAQRKPRANPVPHRSGTAAALTGPILALDNGIQDLGWAVVQPHTGHVDAIGVLHQARNPRLEVSTCRASRLLRQGRELYAIVNEHGCVAIAAEAVSLGGPPKARLAMAASLAGSWGVACALAAALGLELWEVPPKQWQHAIVGASGKVEYDAVFRALSDYLRHGQVWQQFNLIPAGQRNHALDAVGVGVFVALRPEQATRIGGP